uniref:uncharacterized protein LOC105351564 n=1 Tax=Fragaria vesca subsp. vesca TaxID=101020 RepID=UPI0005C903D1|nr:PREDICTED: uncharacterized protein LOC105351564 [Fragaria vesca subsp. vesca]
MMSSTSNSRGRGQNKRYWTDEENDKLLESLLELHHDKKWKADTGFKNGFLKQLQHVMESKLPGCGILANPHIKSRIKTLKTKYVAVAEMLNQSGFSWNEQEMMLVCEKSVYIKWVEKRNKDVAGLYGKPFRHYYILGEIYGRDRANGMNVRNADDDEEEIARENTNADDFNLDDDILFGNVNPIGDMGSQHGGFEDVDASFTQPSAPQQMPTQSASSNTSRRKGKALDEMSKNFGLMAKAVAGMAPKIDGLVNVLSTDKELTDLQSRLDGELSKMESLTLIQVFHVTNFWHRNMICSGYSLP